MKQLIRIWQDDQNRIHLDTDISITDYQVIGLLEAFKHIRLQNFAKGSTYEPHFDIGKDFDRDLEPEEPL
jgi:hypothetical protein